MSSTPEWMVRLSGVLRNAWHLIDSPDFASGTSRKHL
jgi:hypothetical protein